MNGACAPDRHHRCAHLALVQINIRAADHAGSLDKRLHACRDIGKVCRRPEKDAVGFDHFLDALIYDVPGHGTAPVLVLETLETGDTALDRLPRQGIHLGLDPFRLQLFQDNVQEDSGVTLFSPTAVKCYYFHDFTPEYNEGELGQHP